jgi:beta-glucosidase/6-phospho-beta-glucosidase/beta-galactosidase
LELWPRGVYDLLTQISKEYNHPIIEITESGCGYLDAPYGKDNGRQRGFLFQPTQPLRQPQQSES